MLLGETFFRTVSHTEIRGEKDYSIGRKALVEK